MSHLSEFSCDVFESVCLTADCPCDVVTDAVQHWIDGWMAKDDQSLTQLELAILEAAKTTVVAHCQENDDECDEDSDNDDEE